MLTPTRELRRVLGAPVSAMFSVVVAARNTLYDRGVLKQQRLRRPVISVGNISVGGAGKTPFVVMLAELLRQRGVRVDVLSRGYGRKTSGVLVVDAGGSPLQFGDEPLLIARRLPGVPVVVGESRFQAGLEAERRFETDIHLLDDAFQHRQLTRDFDVVLLSRFDLQDRLLPSGRLREPLSSLARADALVWSEPGDIPSLPASIPVWRAHRRVELPPQSPSRPFILCAIAGPQRFLSDLGSAGVHPAGHHWFRDHHAYTEADIRGLCREASRSGADGFLTTEKDAVKLNVLQAQLPNLAVTRLSLELENAQQVLTTILDKVKTG
ncbi:MAG: tetraacyldisaccharide 4'-kinase [Candidatus Korobacteraceae bacterium]